MEEVKVRQSNSIKRVIQEVDKSQALKVVLRDQPYVNLYQESRVRTKNNRSAS